jgi:transcriptional regulator with XRE-family HTH domain
MISEGKHIGERIKIARDKLSQEAVAHATGLSLSSISKYERGAVVPRSDDIVKIANTLNVSVEWLLTGKTSAANTPSAQVVAAPDNSGNLIARDITPHPSAPKEIQDGDVPVILADGQPWRLNGYVVFVHTQEQADLVRKVMSAPPDVRSAIMNLVTSLFPAK